MLRLLYNDFRLNGVWFFWVFLLLNLELGVSVGMHLFYSQYSSLSVGLSYAMIPPLVLFLREEYWKAQVVGRSLPVSPATSVMTRYLAVCVLGLLPSLYGLLFQRIIEILGPHASQYTSLSFRAQQMESGYAIEHSLIARSLGLSIALAIVMPLVIRFGSVWRILIGFVGLRIVWSKFIDFLLGYSLHTSFFLGLSRWVFFATVFVIGILAMSVRVSIWLYVKRDL